MDNFFKAFIDIFGCVFHDYEYSAGIQVITLDNRRAEQSGSYYRSCKKCGHYEVRCGDEWIDCKD